MAFDLAPMVRQDAKRRHGKKELVVPSLVFKPGAITIPREDPVKLLEACAKVIASTGLLYRWKRYTGRVVLVEWNSDSKMFTGFHVESFKHWLGVHFDLKDQSGMHFGLASTPVTARVTEELLRNETDLPWASFQLTDEFRKQGK